MTKKKRQWSKLKEQRDTNGLLTPLALALDALQDNGCDCGEDEPGSCLACLCEAALWVEWMRAERMTKALQQIRELASRPCVVEIATSALNK